MQTNGEVYWRMEGKTAAGAAGKTAAETQTGQADPLLLLRRPDQTSKAKQTRPDKL